MRRTQLLLDDDLWKTLHVQADERGTTVSELARQALREKYSDPAARRSEAMEAVIGIWKDRDDIGPTEGYIRQLRKGSRRRQMLGQ
jgi:hypothetical protein